VKLSPIQCAFLSRATLDASRPLPVIAKTLGVSVSKLRYAVDTLLDRKIVKVVPNIDRSIFGLSDYHIFFSISARNATARSRFLRGISQADGVVFAAELGGNFQFEAIISTKSAREASELLDLLATEAGIELSGKSVASSVSMQIFPKRYLAAGAIKRTPQGLRVAGEPPASTHDPDTDIKLDDLDRRLLWALSCSGEMSVRQLGAMLDVSHATVQYRIDRMRRSGVLRGFYFDVEPLQYGYHDFVWQLSVSRGKARLESRLVEMGLREPSITYVASFFGEWDFELGLEVAEPRLINPLIQRLSEVCGPEFRSIRLMMRFGQLALRLFPFSRPQ
jgi:DNA-binding Lrp family transcriptional regulator